ncbi:hypothetical protein ACE1OE_16830 [Vibrio sp. E150_011]|uniref:hypothetical protein n=1 Tax=Vibrio sp. 10N.261.51.F12 TaxID=3229679 RepID=UPI00355383ED
MAAQKLTKGRLGQIIIMMMVLIAAFTYRTVTHVGLSEVVCKINIPCEVKLQEKSIGIMYQDSTNTLTLTNPEEFTVHATINDGSKVVLANKTQVNRSSLPIDIVISDNNSHSVNVRIK